jgi:hypothetical protein
MANKTIGLRIEIDGLDSITQNVVKLERVLKDSKAQAKALEKEIAALNEELAQTGKSPEEIAALNKQLAKAEKEYLGLKNTIAVTNEELKGSRKEQREFIKDANKAKFKKGSYLELNEQLKALKKQYKELSEEERDSEIGVKLQEDAKRLSKRLKTLDKGLGDSQREVGNYRQALENLLPGFRRFSKALTKANGDLNVFGKALLGGFVAFQAAKFVGQAVKQLDEFVTKINDTKQAVAGFAQVTGEELNEVTANVTGLATTFDLDTEQISKSARALADNLGIGFDEALEKIEGRLVEGTANNKDYLESLEQYPEQFKEASGAITDFSERNRQLVEANKELAKSQVDVAKRLQGVTDTFDQIGATVQTVLFKVLADLIDIFRPVVQAFQRAGAAIGRVFAAFNSFRKEGEQTVTISSLINSTFERLAATFELVANAIEFVANGFTFLIKEVPIVRSAFNAIFNVIADFQKRVRELPFTFAGVVEALKQLGTNFKNFFETLIIDAQILDKKVRGIFSKAAKDQVAELKARRAEINADGRSLGAAFEEGFNEARKRSAEAAEKQRKDALEKERLQAIEAINKKEAAKTKKALAEAQKRAEKLAAAREKFAQEEFKREQARTALLLDLESRIIDERIKLIEDSRERRIAEIERSFEVQRQALTDQENALVEAQRQREQELVKVFGEGSKEVLASREEFTKDLIKIQEQQGVIRKQLEQQEQVELLAAREEFKQQDIDQAKQAAAELRAFRDQALSSELSFIDAQGKQRELRQKATLARQLANEEDAAKRAELIRVNAELDIAEKIGDIRNKLQALDDQEELLRSQAAEGVTIKQEEYDAILNARLELDAQLAEIEKGETERVRQESDKRRDLLTEARKQATEAIAGLVLSLAEREDRLDLERIEKQTERNAAAQESLNSQLEGATGLRRRYLEQQIAQQVEGEKQLAKQKEDIERKAALREKRIAIGKSIIDGILSVQKAAAAAAFPLNVPLVAFATASALARTGQIVSQKFQDGGMIHGPSHAQGGVPFSVGGQLGFEAEGGEFIVNKDATAKNLPILTMINNHEFAEGGFIGGVSPTPSLSAIGTSQANGIDALSSRLAAVINAQRVILSVDDLDEDRSNQERINKRTIIQA